MKNLIAAALLAGLCGAASADTRIGLHVGSYHLTMRDELNAVNPGLYVNHNGWTAGFYYNSERLWSVYGGYTFELPVTERLSVAATAGIITGYRDHPVMPLLVPSARWKFTDHTAARVAFVPKVYKGAAAIHLMLEYQY